jgi:hypothetical protein
VVAALDDRARRGRDPAITAEARAWLVALACAKPTQFGYPHELWTPRLLAAHGRDHGPRAGHPSLAKLEAARNLARSPSEVTQLKQDV